MVNLGYPYEWQPFVPFYSKSQNFKQNQIEIPTTILCIGFSCDIMYWWLMTWIQQKIDVNLCSSDLHFGLIWNFVKYNCSDNHYIGLGQIWLCGNLIEWPAWQSFGQLQLYIVLRYRQLTTACCAGNWLVEHYIRSIVNSFKEHVFPSLDYRIPKIIREKLWNLVIYYSLPFV